MSDSQRQQIIEALKSGRSLTPLEALDEFGCFRLGARIWELRQDGYKIENAWETDGHKRWAKYKLVERT